MLDPAKVRLGIAPIGWTNDDMPDLGGGNTFEQCVSEMALAGFTGCEIGNKYPSEPAKLKAALELRGLTICNRWFSTFLLTKPFEETAVPFAEQLDFLKEQGAKVIGVSEQSYSIQGMLDQPIFEGRHVMDEREWTLLCDGLNQLGEIARDKGMSLTFHHHMGTVVQTEEEIDRMLASTDPERVFLLFDSGHLAYCGVDPLTVLRKHAARVRHVHLKDVRPAVVEQVHAEKLSFLAGVRRGAFTVPGDGSINFGPLFDVLAESGYEGWMVVEAEQDPALANPLEYALKGHRYIREKTGL